MKIEFTKLDRIGITAKGHDRTQHSTVQVKPYDKASSVNLVADIAVKVSNIKADDTTGVIKYDLVGISQSYKEKDSYITSKLDKIEVKNELTVVVPAAIGPNHPTYNGPVPGVNMALDSTTSPYWSSGNPGEVLLVTSYTTSLSIPVVDQFGKSLDKLYDGASVFEGGTSMNQSLSNSSYTDPVGRIGVPAGGAVYQSSDPQVAAWLSGSTQAPLSGDPPKASSVAVEVDGFSLNPAVKNRTIIATPPNNIEVKWP